MRCSSHTYNLSTNHYWPNEEHQTLTSGLLSFPRQPGAQRKSDLSVTGTSFTFACCRFHTLKLDIIKDVAQFQLCCHCRRRMALLQVLTLKNFVYARFRSDHTVFNYIDPPPAPTPLFLCYPAGYFTSLEGTPCERRQELVDIIL